MQFLGHHPSFLVVSESATPHFSSWPFRTCKLLLPVSTVRAARLRMPELLDPPVLGVVHVVVLWFPICGSGGRQSGSSLSASDAAFARISWSSSSQGSVHFCASRLGLVLRVRRGAYRDVLCACAKIFVFMITDTALPPARPWLAPAGGDITDCAVQQSCPRHSLPRHIPSG